MGSQRVGHDWATSSVSHLYDHDLELCLCLALGLSLSSGMKCLSVTSFYLTYCVYFCVLGRLVMFPDFGEVAFGRRCLLVPAVHPSVFTRAACYRGARLCGLCGPFCCGRLTAVGSLEGVAGLLVWWVARPCLVQRQLTTGWQVDREAVKPCEACPGAGAGSLEPGIGSRRFWSWFLPPGGWSQVLGSHFRALVSQNWCHTSGGYSQFLIQLATGSGVLFFFFKLCWILVAACELLIEPCRLYFSDQGVNPGPLYWECGVLATGPPWTSWVRGVLKLGLSPGGWGLGPAGPGTGTDLPGGGLWLSWGRWGWSPGWSRLTGVDWGSGESGADVCPLVDRAGSQDGQVYCLCTGAWPSGGQGCVQGWLWAQGS